MLRTNGGLVEIEKKIDFFELCNSSMLRETLQNFAFYKYPKKMAV